ncbi:MAG TPA: type II toxin-antitoxin system prevent-host-death family antitoxin [Patescibacteria group bacterium]|nr:type II toxin-antitoxin system prevent-host-death family antitoxin [Patescibacteria group bacterium]
MVQTLSSSEARERFSSLIDDVYFRGNDIVVKRNGVPLVRIIKYANKNDRVLSQKKKSLKLRTFGMWKDKKGTTLEILEELKSKAWRSHAR